MKKVMKKSIERMMEIAEIQDGLIEFTRGLLHKLWTEAFVVVGSSEC